MREREGGRERWRERKSVENGSGRQKDEGGQEIRKEGGKDEQMREGEQKACSGERRVEMTALMRLHE